jgi:endo-1,3(4)-beta-glucanase
MLPLTAASVYTRPAKFVREEWDVYFNEKTGIAPASKVQGGWKGILYANLALIDAKKSYDWFKRDQFDEGALDGGASRTWGLAMAAALGGA